MEQTLSETSKLVKDNPVIDWNKILHLIHITNDGKEPEWSSTRMRPISTSGLIFTKKCRKNPIGWFPWLYSQLELKDGETVWRPDAEMESCEREPDLIRRKR